MKGNPFEHIPDDYRKKILLFKKEFEALQKKNKNWSSPQIVRELSILSGVSERSIRRYKEDWSEATTTRVNRVQIEREKTNLVKIYKPSESVKKDKKREIITEVCNEFSKGEAMLTKILDERGLTRYLFNLWINEDEEYLVMFNKSTEMHNQSYGHRLDESIRAMILTYVGAEQQQERTVTYEYVPIINPDNPEEIIYDKIPVSETIKYKPIKPEPIMVKQILESIREFKDSLRDSENKDIQALLSMSENQLDEQIAQMELERNKPQRQ
jgi:hypothetical protein